LERTLVLIKPDGLQRGLVGEIISRLEKRGLRLSAVKMIQVPLDLAQRHYAVHEGKPFYEGLIKHITSSPVVAMVWEGPKAIAAVRQTMGATHPTDANPGTVRHDLGLDARRNLTHASDSPENAESEIALWFEPEEILTWTRDMDRWIYV
jgi:nucleoside-diphosphate kinase